MPQILNNEAVTKDVVIKLSYLDLQAIGTGGTKVIATIPAGGSVTYAAVVQTVAEAGSTSLVFDVGTTLADPDEFIDALDADAMTLNLPVYNTGDTLLQAAGNSTILAGLRPARLTATALPVYLKVTDAAIASLTAGEWIIAIGINDLLKFNP
jgi:hypothetical protein